MTDPKGPPYLVGITQNCQDGFHGGCKAGPKDTVELSNGTRRPGGCKCSCHKQERGLK